MEKSAFIEALKLLTSNEDPLSVSRDVSELRGKFEDLVLEEERKFQVAQLEAKERGEEPEEAAHDEIREAFYVEFNAYKERRNTAQRVKADAESIHLVQKRKLIDRLKNVIQTEENIGAALNQYKEIHEEWKHVGDVPREKRQELQSEYSRLVEDFFYHLKIYRELREHDLHRNFQLKKDVIARIQQLEKVETIKDIEQSIKALQHEWDECGPVNNDAWETLKAEYWEAVRVVYARVQGFYDERKQELTVNLEKKQALLERAAEFGALQLESGKEWEEATARLIALQDEWKQIGAGPRKENEEIWKTFRASCDAFFATKKSFFDAIRSQYDGLAKKKQALIDKVVLLKDSTDWKSTSEKIIHAQKEWKAIGNSGQRSEQKLWKEFRAACDEFFNAKQAHFAEQDQQLEGNLTAKQALIERIKALEVPADRREALDLLKQLSNEYAAIGFVPMKFKDSVYNEYKAAIDAHYTALKLEGAEKDRIQFQGRLEDLKSRPNADRAIAKERMELVDKVNKLKADILQYENNLGFFAKSKGADVLRKEVEGKISAAQRKIEELKVKIKQLTVVA